MPKQRNGLFEEELCYERSVEDDRRSGVPLVIMDTAHKGTCRDQKIQLASTDRAVERAVVISDDLWLDACVPEELCMITHICREEENYWNTILLCIYTGID